jgi:hypothetical protein
MYDPLEHARSERTRRPMRPMSYPSSRRALPGPSHALPRLWRGRVGCPAAVKANPKTGSSFAGSRLGGDNSPTTGAPGFKSDYQGSRFRDKCSVTAEAEAIRLQNGRSLKMMPRSTTRPVFSLPLNCY